MNRDDIYQTWGDLVRRHTRGGACNFQDAAKELAELVAAAEREACAKVCADLAMFADCAAESDTIWKCMEAIRARNNNV